MSLFLDVVNAVNSVSGSCYPLGLLSKADAMYARNFFPTKKCALMLLYKGLEAEDSV